MSDKNNQVVIYKAPGGAVSLEVKLQGETVWLSLNQMAELFGRDKSVISRHLRKVFKDKELDRNSVVAFFATTASDQKTYNVKRGTFIPKLLFSTEGDISLRTFCMNVPLPEGSLRTPGSIRGVVLPPTWQKTLTCR
jgi:hypothetical protein